MKAIAGLALAMACFILAIAGFWDLAGVKLIWAAFAVALVVSGSITIEWAHRRRAFRKAGYEVICEADRGFLYREICNGSVRELRLPGDLIEVGHEVYTRLSRQEWEQRVPDWARHRQLEIEARILENPDFRPEGY
ncbi:hypothetical protein OKA04_05180 [Luteolibacter flavescens]|uniref:Uncharacterized protein n=1 Tax=Luteolibacter flavescens TaxID=1859460 RepID=A0ABT3FKM6_9BACT|nr:hypothetical protein [Luteolibacter flavescens]MCW1884112.1 hypothetical protein [Luteolibacter flavescens]